MIQRAGVLIAIEKAFLIPSVRPSQPRLHMLILPLILGCADIAKLKALSETVGNTHVLVGAYIGITPPDDDSLDMSGSEFSATAIVTTVLADATDVSNLGDSPVTDAVASWKSPTNGKVDMPFGDLGAYQATSADGVVYTDGETVVISAEWEGTHSAEVTSPPPARFAIEEEHEVGVGVTIDLTEQDYDSVFVVVYDGVNQVTTFDNRPTDIGAIYDWTHGGGDIAVDIPGASFGEPSVYALGVAGIRHSDAGDFTDANTLLSTYASGKFQFYVVSTLPTAP